MKSLALVAACLIVAVASAQSKSPVQKAIEQQMANHNQAMTKKDMNGVKATMSPDFEVFDVKGQPVPKKAVLAQLAALFNQAKGIVATSKIQSFKIVKGDAQLVSNNTLDCQLPGQSGKLAKVHMETSSNETWTSIKGVYKVKMVKAIKRKVTVDGKVVSGA